MIKVIVVDDESLIRIGFRHFQWEAFGCELAGDAPDGLSGLELAKKVHADIHILDIRMPKMNGLELARKIKEINPEGKIVLLTGHNEFEYAQAAINTGVDYFLLKPTNFDEFSKILVEITGAISAHRQRQQDIEHTLHLIDQAAPLAVMNLFQNLLSGNYLPPEEIEGHLNAFGITLEKAVIIAAMQDQFHLPYKNNMKTVFDNYMIINAFLLTSQKYGCHMQYMINGNELIILLLYTEETSDSDCICITEKICLEVQEHICSSLEETFLTFGISGVCHHASDFCQEYLHAKKALNSVQLSQNCTLCIFSPALEENGIPFILEPYRKDILFDSIFSGNQEQTEKILYEIQNELFHNNPGDSRSIKLCIMEIVFDLLKRLNQSAPDISLNMIASLEELISDSGSRSIRQLFSALCEIINCITGHVSACTLSILPESCTKIMNYIKINCCDEELSLDTLSNEFHLSNAHISRLLKKECGKTFIELLTERRMEKAKIYLQLPGCKVFEAARMVGYRDVSYFIKLFKKYTGVTPNQFN